MHKIITKILAVLLLFVLIMSSSSLTIFADNTPSGIVHTKLDEVIDTYAKEYIGNATAGASVAVLEKGKIIFKSNYGYSDIENKASVTDETIFEWGSTTKLLVWVSVMQLVEQGKIDIDKDIKIYLPEKFLRKLQFNEPITMLNLMNHNGGWEEHLTDMFYSDPQSVKSLKETLDIFEPTQVYKPSEVVSYSNYGAALAAYIVECITDMNFYEYVNHNIFAVLDMKETAIHPLQKDNIYVQKNRLSTKGYIKDSKGFRERPIYYLSLYPAGGAVGTLTDMCKFVSALMPKDGETSPLFKYENTLDTMFSKSYEPTDDFPGISHGFWEHYYSVRTLEHGGNTDSFSSQITLAPKERLAILIMTNQAHERAFCYGLKDKIFGSYKADKYEDQLPDSSIVSGKYRNLRRPYSGFSQWLNFIVNEVRPVDENTIDVDGDIYHQIRPYVYQYTDEGGASEFIYFNVKNGQVKSMYQEYGEYEPVGKFTEIGQLGIIGMIILSVIYFVIAFIVSIGCGFKKRSSISSRDKGMILLNLIGFVSIVNTCILFYRSTMYPSYASLLIHFIINILSILLITVLLCTNLYLGIKRKIKEKRKIGYIFANIFSLLYVGLIIVCQLYK